MNSSLLTGMETQNATSSSRDMLNEMIKSMREGIIVVARDGTILSSNPAARVLFGEAIETCTLRDIIPQEKVQRAFEKAFENGELTELQVEIPVRADNRIYDLRVAPLDLERSNAKASAIGIFYDVTRLERLERVRQEFLSNVSHELRTPLTSILAFVETLVDGALEDDQNNRRFLEVIRRNAERMHHLIDDILELSAIEAGKVDVKPRIIRLAPLVHDVWSSLSEKWQREPKINFRNEVENDVTVFADPRRLEQILTNLISNAAKFNREGGYVAVSHKDVGSFHQILVKDDGDGISREHLPRIFERFYRTDTARSRELGGTGLGLAIVKHLARLHGGEARVVSALGSGSTFIIDLPKGS
jgi:two-component system, OmpR family, phosphate regulon sensor histidine kinase PhoR